MHLFLTSNHTLWKEWTIPLTLLLILHWMTSETQSWASWLWRQQQVSGSIPYRWLESIQIQKHNFSTYVETTATLSLLLCEFQKAFLRPWRELQEGDVICRDVPSKREQLNPFRKGPGRSLLVKGTCNGHFTKVISVFDHVIFCDAFQKQSCGWFWQNRLNKLVFILMKY